MLLLPNLLQPQLLPPQLLLLQLLRQLKLLRQPKLLLQRKLLQPKLLQPHHAHVLRIIPRIIHLTDVALGAIRRSPACALWAHVIRSTDPTDTADARGAIARINALNFVGTFGSIALSLIAVSKSQSRFGQRSKFPK